MMSAPGPGPTQPGLLLCIRDRFEPPTWSASEGVWLHNRSANEVANDLLLPIEAVYLAKSRVLSGSATN